VCAVRSPGGVPRDGTVLAREIELAAWHGVDDMSFDDIMRRSGLDPNDPDTFWLIALDDLNLEGLLGRDLIEPASELAGPTPKINVRPHYMNVIAYVVEVQIRANHPDFRHVTEGCPATRLQRSTRDRVVH